MIILNLDTAVYSLEAVQNSAYKFIDRLTIVISKNKNSIQCEIEGIEIPCLISNTVIDDFKRELLDQQLRLKIKKETEDVRNLILSYAFSGSNLQS